MNRNLIISLTSLVLFTLAMCTRNNVGPDEQDGLAFVRTDPGGCNGIDSSRMKSVIDGTDTVYFKIRNDTLDAFIGLNYICCAPFKPTVLISADSIFMTVTDTCPDLRSCYCRCMCYYSWDFLFTGMQEKKYYYRVTLVDPQQEGPIIFREGMIDLGGK
jgi:hypothetical protein